MSVCWSSSGVPEPCGGWNIYDSYKTDPRYQRVFTIAWTGTLALVVLTRVPAYLALLSSGEWRNAIGGWQGFLGVHEDQSGGYRRVVDADMQPTRKPRRRRRTLSTIRKPFLAATSVIHSVSRISIPIPSVATRILPSRWRLPPSCHPSRTYLPFSLGHLAWALLIPAFLLATLLPESELRANPNRFGFLALACLPPIFVLSVKNGPVAWIVGRGWTAVNFLHRWLGRMMVLLVLLHFYFWTIQYSGSAQTAFLAGEKERRGITALAFLLLITLSSLPPMRRFSYPIFFLLHYVGLIGFLVSINRHTVYAGPWATYIVMAIYASDILGRIASMRVRWVEAEALEGGMVKISMPGVAAGWRGGQHLSVRLFFVPPPLSMSEGTGRFRRLASQLAHGLRGAVRPFEAHPLSIATVAPKDAVSLASESGVPRGIELYARSCGPDTWTGDLHRYVVEAARPLPVRARSTTASAPSPRSNKSRKVYIPCLFEGPYGGIPAHESPSIQNDTETVLLVAGGSGMSFVLGVLNSIVGRRLATGKAGRVEVVWTVRQRAHLAWFADRLSEVVAVADGSPLRVVVRTFVTCDETLTTAVPTSSSPESAASTNAESSTSPREILLSRFAGKATISYIRPSLRDLVRETVDRALAPCGHCFPVCRCGELATASAAGMCANDEEECVGGCGGVANARELVVDEDAENEKKQKDRIGEDEKDEIDSLPALAQKAGVKPCCLTKASTLDIDTISEITELPTVVNVGPSSCCGPTLVGSSSTLKSGCGGCCSRTTGGGCCTGAIIGPASPARGDRDEQDRQEGKPLRVRTEGMAVIVCGPSNMVAETRNAVARIPLAKQVRIGGIACHVEQYSV
ncbi:hypothetical protein B0A53_03779 [Rhodotorula sp. CCFEE 5036]|nr:hypothetical protein B0A53_03779 [Rhodotorula sp. CCFEE 5036]